MDFGFIDIVILMKSVHSLFYLCLCIHLYVETQGELLYRSNVCIKERAHNVLPIYDEAKQFKDFVEKSDVFVDKSLLIKALLEDGNSALYITCPRKFGKSINLHMLKTFMEIERRVNGSTLPMESTWSYRFFTKGEIITSNNTIKKLLNPPLIAEHRKLIKKYLGKFPALHFDFTRLVVEENTYDGFVRAFRKSMSEIYKEYSFLKNELRSIQESNLPMVRTYAAQIQELTFEQYELGKPQVDALQNGLKFLSELLHSHYRKRVFMLVDEPEYPFNQNNFPSDQEKIIRQFCAGFVEMSVTSNTHLSKAIITGVLELSEEDSEEDYEGDFRNIIRMYNIVNNPMYQFYGFTSEEMEMLFEHLKVPTKLSQSALHRYRGYRMSYNTSSLIYNVWSIVNFLNTHRVENYWWRSTCSSQRLYKLFSFPEVRQMYESIMEGKYRSIHHNDTRFTLEEVSMIKQLIRREYLKIDTQIESMLLSYFYASGYLTMTSAVTHFMERPVEFIELRISNAEIKGGIDAVLNRYKEVKSITNINLDLVHNMTDHTPQWKF